MGDLFFVTSLGKGRYEETTYRLDDKTAQTRFAPAATAKLLDLAGACALLLATRDVENSDNCRKLCEELQGLGFTTEIIPISASGDRQDLMEILKALDERIPANARLFLDVTYGLRHLPFMYHAAVTFLSALKGVTLNGIYYGALELREQETVPLISIGHTFDLIAWFQALRTFRESGDASAIARSLSDEVKRLFAEQVRDTDLARLKDDANRLADALGIGLPLEAGIEAGRLCDDAGRLERQSVTAFASYLGAEMLRAAVEGWKLPAAQDKAKLVLDQKELKRQVDFADWLLQRGDLGSALRVLRELLVNVALIALGRAGNWLERDSRAFAERYLAALVERSKSKLLARSFQAEIAGVWSSVAEFRNRAAHSGMLSTDARVSHDAVHERLCRCRELLDRTMAPSPPAGAGRLLVSPLGLSPGVLFSALKHVNPDRLLVITSREAAASLEEVLGAAGCADIEPRVFQVEDPHMGFSEDRRLFGSSLDSDLAESAEVVVNITGGTTALQWLVERVAERAVRLGVTLSRIALVDRRPPEVQRREPFVLGELIKLSPVPGGIE